MSAGLFFLFLIVVGALIFAAVVVAPLLSAESRATRREVREARQEAVCAEQRASIATKALRRIANGAGNPILEASEALDQLESTYTKELN
jgi:hypothetical protein